MLRHDQLDTNIQVIDKTSDIFLKKPWVNYENVYPKPYKFIDDADEQKFLNKIEDSKKSIIAAEKELEDSLKSQEFKDRLILENLISSKKEKLNELKIELSKTRDETEQEKHERTVNELNLLNLAKQRLIETTTEHNSIIVPPLVEKSDFSRKKNNVGNNENREKILLQKNRLANLINTRQEDVRIAENLLNKVRNEPNKYQTLLSEINSLNLEINQNIQKLNSSNNLSRNHAILESKIELLKNYLAKNIENYEKFKLQGVSIITKDKIEDYDSNGNLYKIIINISEMHDKLNKLDANPPTLEYGNNITAQVEYDFLSKFYVERNRLYNMYKLSDYVDINEIDKDHLKWLNDFKLELIETRSRLKELNVILKNQIFWTDIDHEKYDIQKREILNKHITYLDQNKIEEEYIKKEINFNKTTDITMEEYLQSIKYQG
jgi:hypothetical protein